MPMYKSSRSHLAKDSTRGFNIVLGFIAMVAGGALAINQTIQLWATQQQAAIAAHEAALGHHYVYQHVGSLFGAGFGAAVFVVGAIWFFRGD